MATIAVTYPTQIQTGPGGNALSVKARSGFKTVPKRMPLPVLPYQFYYGSIKQQSVSNDFGQEFPEGYPFASIDGTDQHASIGGYGTGFGEAQGFIDQGKNRCYQKFVGKLGTQASLGVATAEARQSIDLIVKRARQVGSLLGAIRSRNPSKVLRNLPKVKKLSKGQKVRLASHKTSDLWLEYWFAWAPLLSDIGDAVEILQGPWPPVKIASSAPVSGTVGENGVHTGYSVIDSKFAFSGTVRWRAEISVSNPNLYLAQQMGFANPAAIAWELVPYSFVVDWFLPIGQFLESLSDFAGVSLDKPCLSVSGRVQGTRVETFDFYPHTKTIVEADVQKFFRSTEAPSFTLRPTPLGDMLNPTRAASAVSLLIKRFISAR